MKHSELTECVSAAKTLPMQGNHSTMRHPGWRGYAAAVLIGSVMAGGGCVSVTAPDKPIVIELNINIKQEVIYRLAQDAETTIDQNSGVF